MAIIIGKTTAAVANSELFNVTREEPVTLTADALATTEEVDIFYRGHDVADWKPLIDSTGAAVKLTATIYQQVLNGVGTYYVAKDATAGACGVFARS